MSAMERLKAEQLHRVSFIFFEKLQVIFNSINTIFSSKKINRILPKRQITFGGLYALISLANVVQSPLKVWLSIFTGHNGKVL